MDTEKEFLNTFRQLSERHSSWSAWHDFIFASAAAISNRFDKRPGVWHERENRYLTLIKQYTKDEQRALPHLLALTIEAFQTNPAQDFLGKLFMELELSNHWKGQFFTPYSVADLMSAATIGDGESAREKIREQGYISINDPTCGSGVMLIAVANRCRYLGIDYPNEVLFVGQDIDETAALMCYIQLSILDCACYVDIGDALTEPSNTVVKQKQRWYTPVYFSKQWREKLT